MLRSLKTYCLYLYGHLSCGVNVKHLSISVITVTTTSQYICLRHPVKSTSYEAGPGDRMINSTSIVQDRLTDQHVYVARSDLLVLINRKLKITVLQFQRTIIKVFYVPIQEIQ